MMETLKYTILDPTGNITALVESPLPPSRQKHAADLIMQKHPEVEQVGFVEFEADRREGRSAGKTVSGAVPDASLRMAGGEFCGNASMCAASLCRIRTGNKKEKLLLRVSGASHPVEVALLPDEKDSFQGDVLMPPAVSLEYTHLSFGTLSGALPAVNMEGISHIIIAKESPFFCLLSDRKTAESAVKAWCGQLSCDGLGLMFLDREKGVLTPLVYIPGSGTVFWENSCASGTTAVGLYLAEAEGSAIDLCFKEPGGILHVSSDPLSRRTHLRGKVSLVKSGSINL